MNTIKSSHKGQTLIETVLMLMLLFILFFGIAEIARAWWLKSQLNNAARVGVRVAIVDATLTPQASTQLATCSWTGSTCAPGTAGNIQNATCGAITNGDLCNTSKVYLTVTGVDSTTGNPPGTTVSPGGIITVQVTGVFYSVVPALTDPTPGGFGFTSLISFLRTRTLGSESTMRHE